MLWEEPGGNDSYKYIRLLQQTIHRLQSKSVLIQPDLCELRNTHMTERWTAAPCSLHILIWCNCKKKKNRTALLNKKNKTLEVSDSNPPPAWRRLYAWTFASANNILCWFGLGQCRHCPPAGWSLAKNSSSSSSYKRDAAERVIHAASGI